MRTFQVGLDKKLALLGATAPWEDNPPSAITRAGAHQAAFAAKLFKDPDG